MEDLKAFLKDQIDGQEDDHAKTMKVFLKDIKSYEESKKLIWVGRMDNVHGDGLIAFGQSEKEVETLLYKKYKEVAKYRNEYDKLNGSSLVPRHGQRTKADFLEYFGGWIQPMHIGKAYIGDEDESISLATKSSKL